MLKLEPQTDGRPSTRGGAGGGRALFTLGRTRQLRGGTATPADPPRDFGPRLACSPPHSRGSENNSWPPQGGCIGYSAPALRTCSSPSTPAFSAPAPFPGNLDVRLPLPGCKLQRRCGPRVIHACTALAGLLRPLNAPPPPSTSLLPAPSCCRDRPTTPWAAAANARGRCHRQRVEAVGTGPDVCQILSCVGL